MFQRPCRHWMTLEEEPRVVTVPHVPTRVARVELPRKLAAVRKLHALEIRPQDFVTWLVGAGESSYAGGETPRSL